jgi:hypothetical protein
VLVAVREGRRARSTDSRRKASNERIGRAREPRGSSTLPRMSGPHFEHLDQDEDDDLDEQESSEALPWPPGWDKDTGLPAFYRPTSASTAAAEAFRRAFDECIAEDRISERT